MDPNPNHMVEVLSRCAKAVFLCHQQGEIGWHNTQRMLSVLCNTLNVLLPTSKAASSALLSIRKMASAAEVETRTEIGHHAAVA